MSPRLLLSLWRERWGKAARETTRVSYRRGKLTGWFEQLTDLPVWSMRGTSLIALLCCLAFFWLTVQVDFTTAGQLIFSSCLACVGLYLRRYWGVLITLFLVSLSLIATYRYLDWRFSSVLGRDFTPVLLLALGLVLAEFYFWILTALGFMVSFWPLKRGTVPLPPDTASWPTVDVFIPVYSEQLRAIEALATSARALNWPADKLNIYLFGDQARPEVAEFAKSRGIKHLILSNAPEIKSEHVNLAAEQTTGEVIALLQYGQLPDPQLLKNALGWFVEDPKLGLIQTPHYRSTPDISETCRAVCSDYPSNAAFALVQREVLTQQIQDYQHSLIGFLPTENSTTPALVDDENQTMASRLELFLVDDAFSKSALIWKKRILAVHDALSFYYVLPRVIFFTAPLFYLLAGVDLVQAAPGALLVYFLPHILHIYFVTERLDAKTRPSTWEDLKETALAWYLLVPTALSFFRTKISQLITTVKRPGLKQSEPFERLVAWPSALVLALNLIGFWFGLQHRLRDDGLPEPVVLMYMVWALSNLLLLTASFAIAEETRQIRQHLRKQLRHDVMIQLPTGRTITGVTQNFPDLVLSIDLPVKTDLQPGTALGLSLFRSQKEFIFSVGVAANDNQGLKLAILNKSKDDYAALGALALSRDEHWPGFLPGLRADRPVPMWISKPSMAVFGKLFDIAEKWGLIGSLNRLASRIK